MYKAFFKLRRNPFELSPDPYFLFPTARHYEALANLYYAIRGRKGFVVLTGEVGTGKTLLLRCLLDKLERHRVQCAYVFNPILEPEEFLRYIVADFGLQGEWKDKSSLLMALHDYLIRGHRQGQTSVLVLDEAHLLSQAVLEESRLLSNLETPWGKLLQIALVGQPELDAKLDSPELRQLKQRIALRCRLEPLNWEEVQEYVNWRLKRAGANGESPIFPVETLRTVCRYSRGYPRLINTICENALISALAVGARTVPIELIEEACTDLHLTPGPPADRPVEGGPGQAEPDARRHLEGPAECLSTAAAPDLGPLKHMPEGGR